jgi:integrase
MRGCRPLTDSEIALVSRSFGGTYAARDRALFIVGIKTGFRIAELLSLQVGDVWQYGRVVDQVTVERAHMKQ